MVVFKKWNVCVLLFAIILGVMIMPFTSALSQDYKNVERKLGQMVAAGDITLEQAMVMIEALKEHNEDKMLEKRELAEREEAIEEEEAYWEEQEELIEELWAWIEKEGDAIKEALESGKMNEGQAWGKWDYFLEKELAPKLKYLVEEDELDEEMAFSIWGRIMSITKDKKAEAKKVSDAQRDAERILRDWIKNKKAEQATKHRKEGFQPARAWWENVQRRELAPMMDRMVKAGQISKMQYNAIWKMVKDGDKKALEAEAAKVEQMKQRMERNKKRQQEQKKKQAEKKSDKKAPAKTDKKK